MFQEVDFPGDLAESDSDSDFELLPELWAEQMRECATAHSDMQLQADFDQQQLDIDLSGSAIRFRS